MALGVVDNRRRDRLTAHLVVGVCLFTLNLLILMIASAFSDDEIAYTGAALAVLLIATPIAGYAINHIEDYFTRPKPIHCKHCRWALPLDAEWQCGYCGAANNGSPVGACRGCGSPPKAISCPNPDCDQAVLLRAPLGNDPVASYDHRVATTDQHTKVMEEHRRRQEEIQKNRELAEAQAELLKAQEKTARAEQALARAQETPEQTYERQVLEQLQSEGKRRQVIAKLRDAIENESDEDERDWKAAVLDRIERESLDL